MTQPSRFIPQVGPWDYANIARRANPNPGKKYLMPVIRRTEPESERIYLPKGAIPFNGQKKKTFNQ